MTDRRTGRAPSDPGIFPASLENASALQRRLAARVRSEPLPEEVRLVAGADLSYDRETDRLFAALVVWDRRTRALLETARFEGAISIPYVPGFLSFREGPAIVGAWQRLSIRPDVLICDGHGLAHPRRFGLACHVGLALDVPTIGVAKRLLVGEYRDPGTSRGCATRLRHRGDVVGLVLRTRKAVKPVFVSIGHRAELAGARRLVLSTARPFRLPEPQRMAHREVTRMRADRDTMA